ncbi:MAG: hypothetical protein NVSMB57_02590 [Actinomycetota bacterium]
MKRSPAMSALIAVVAIASITIGTAKAATPASGTIDGRNRHLSWSGGPLFGTAPLSRNVTCKTVNCDDFALTIAVPPKLFKSPKVPVVSLRLTTSKPNDVRLLLFKPGADTSSPASGYAVYGTSADLVLPTPGTWKVRAACYACANASYSVTADLTAYKPPVLEPLNGYSFSGGLIPGKGVGEPGVAVDKQGRVFVNGPLDNGNAGGTVWVSSNHGRTWDTHSGLDKLGPSGDSDLAVAPDDGTVYFMNLAYGSFSNVVYTSRDHGQTWTGPAIAGTQSDRQWFTAAPNGRVYVTYHDFGSPLNQMYVTRSDDYGKTFTQVSTVTLGAPSMVDSSCGNHEAGRPQIDPHNPDIYYIFYSVAPLADCETKPVGNDHELSPVWLAKSIDGGKTFTHTKVYQSAAGNTDHNLMGLSIDHAGNLYIVIAESNGRSTYSPVVQDPLSKIAQSSEQSSEEEAGLVRDARTVASGPDETVFSTHVKLFVSKDQGATWSGPLLVDQLKDHHSNVFAAVAAGDAGRVDIAWYTSRATSFLDSTASWTVALAQSTNALSAKPTFKQTRVSPRVMHIGGICQAGLGCTATGVNRNLADFLGIDIGPDGRANVVWADDVSGETRVAYGRQTGGPSAQASRSAAKTKRHR